MAKETKAEKMARLEAERLARLTLEAEDYLPRLMKALESATTNASFNLKVIDGFFQLDPVEYDRRYAISYALSPTYSATYQCNLEELEDDLAALEEERNEELRQTYVKIAALNKLSEEEKRLLGLI